MPRRKITKPQGLDDLKAIADDLPDLTDNQQRFVEGILAGKTASDAYRAAYNTSTDRAATIWGEASKLIANPDVARWLSAARKACLGSAVVTKDGHLQQLERLREIALDTGNVGAAVQAEQYRGKVGGLYVERYEDVTPIDPVQTLEAIASFAPDVARQLAIKHGLALTSQLIDVTPERVTEQADQAAGTDQREQARAD